jgi:hypothetical protein
VGVDVAVHCFVDAYWVLKDADFAALEFADEAKDAAVAYPVTGVENE